MRKSLLSVAAIFLVLATYAQWLPQNAGFTNDTLGFYEMSIPNKHTAWAVCFDIRAGLASGRFILDFTRTTNGGATWTPGKIGNDHTLEYSNISAIDENEAWVAMNKRFTGGGGLYHTIDGGLTWEKASPSKIFDENSFPDFVYFKDKNHGIAMGDPNGGYFEVYTTDNKGKKWKRVPQADLPASLPNEYGFVSGYAAVNNTIWFGTTSGRMYKSADFGKTWTVNVVDPAGKFVNEIAFNDDMLHGVAHLRDNVGNTFLYATTDGGITWTNLNQPTNWKSSRITAVPGTDALISTGINGNAAFRGSAISYDNGTTWAEIENVVSKTVSRFYDAETGYACGAFVTGPPLRGGIFKSQIVFQLRPQEHGKSDIVKGSSRGRQTTASKDDASTGAQVNVYPMPATSVINVALPNSLVKIRSVVSIISMDGKVLKTTNSVGTRTIQLSVSTLPPGAYVVRIVNSGKTIDRQITITR